MKNETSYTNSGNIVTITKELLDDQLGERDWDNEILVKFEYDIGYGDVVFRLRGKSKTTDNAWDYNVMVKDDYKE